MASFKPKDAIGNAYKKSDAFFDDTASSLALIDCKFYKNSFVATKFSHEVKILSGLIAKVE